MNAPAPRGQIRLSAETIETARAFGTSGSTSTAGQLLASLARESKLPPAIRAAYYEAADATKRLADLVSLAVEARDASVLAAFDEDQPPAANDADVVPVDEDHVCARCPHTRALHAYTGDGHCDVPECDCDAFNSTCRAVDRATRPTDPAPASTWDVETIARACPGVHDVACDRVGPNAVRVRLRGADTEAMEAIRERVVAKTGLTCVVEERQDVMP